MSEPERHSEHAQHTKQGDSLEQELQDLRRRLTRLEQVVGISTGWGRSEVSGCARGEGPKKGS